MSTPRTWLGISTGEWLINSNTRHTRLGRYPLLVVEEAGYIPFEPEAANLPTGVLRCPPATNAPASSSPPTKLPSNQARTPPCNPPPLGSPRSSTLLPMGRVIQRCSRLWDSFRIASIVAAGRYISLRL